MSGHRRVCLGGESCCCLHPGTQRKRRAMCDLLIFKPSVCQVSAVGMRPRTHTHSPTIPLSLPAWTAAGSEVIQAVEP